MKKTKIIIAIISIAVVLYFIKNSYDKYQWNKDLKTPKHQLQVGSYVFSVTRTSNTDTYTSSNYYIVSVVTDIDNDYVRLATVHKFVNAGDQINSLPSKNDDYYNNLKSTIDTIKFTVVDVDENMINVGDQKNILKYYPVVKKQPFYYTVGYANKPIPLDARGNPRNDYFDKVYSKNEIIENAKLVRYDLTNRNDGIPVLYDLDEKIELIVNKK